ncbi:MAG: ion transporter [Gemmatimonadetes bacterium]|jgi:voltage-gated potassium channel|nr:ion transporter [Gemmatimonadota bacterium]MBT7863107.1 ion transporter [Gemmatimonadota bacterium]
MTDPAHPHARNERRQRASWRRDLYRIIFEADSGTGKFFDVALLWAIGLSVVAVMLESVSDIREQHGDALRTFEWIVTAVFTIEFVLRLIAAARPLRYATSFFGVVDVLAILPTYLSLFFTGTHSLLIIRALRLLRIFRILKLAQYVGEARLLAAALRSSSRKIFIFLGTVFTIQLIVGSLMYLIEGEESGFTSIPQGVYWAIVTMTTVGYGDITPVTAFGKLLAACVMITGFGIIAVPTGLVVSELGQVKKNATTTRCCSNCMGEGHDDDAQFCKHCGDDLAGL